MAALVPLLKNVSGPIAAPFVAILLLLMCSPASASSCPSGYHKDGNYCVPNSSNSRPIIPRLGSCPSGWSRDGDWCVQSQGSYYQRQHRGR